MYIPKNKIITNLYANRTGVASPDGSDNDFIRSPFYIKDTDLIYEGYYWKDHTGKYYTGKTPKDKPTQELVFIQRSPINNETSQRFQVTLDNSPPNYPFPGEEETTLFIPTLPQEYINIKNPNSNTPPPNVNLPTQSYPKPTENDYKVGNFKRYFCVKTNEDIYLELDKKTYDKLSSKNSNWAHELYTTFQLVWYITGEESQVESTNKNLVLIQEQRSNRKGLKEFLRENYTKFWLP